MGGVDHPEHAAVAESGWQVVGDSASLVAAWMVIRARAIAACAVAIADMHQAVRAVRPTALSAVGWRVLLGAVLLVGGAHRDTSLVTSEASQDRARDTG